MAWMMNDRVGSPLGSCPWRTHAAAPSFHTECHRPPRSYSDCTVLPSSSLSALSQRVTNTIRCLITVLIAPNYWFTVSLSEWTCVCVCVPGRESTHTGARPSPSSCQSPGSHGDTTRWVSPPPSRHEPGTRVVLPLDWFLMTRSDLAFLLGFGHGVN